MEIGSNEEFHCVEKLRSARDETEIVSEAGEWEGLDGMISDLYYLQLDVMWHGGSRASRRVRQEFGESSCVRNVCARECEIEAECTKGTGRGAELRAELGTGSEELEAMDLRCTVFLSTKKKLKSASILLPLHTFMILSSRPLQ
jgi:hypothetical protein